MARRPRKRSWLNRLKSARQCKANWFDMSGSERARTCHRCGKKVFNCYDMDQAEAEAYVSKKLGKKVKRLYRRTDDTVMARRCPVGADRYWYRVLIGATALFVIVCGIVYWFAGDMAGMVDSHRASLLGYIAPDKAVEETKSERLPEYAPGYFRHDEQLGDF